MDTCEETEAPLPTVQQHNSATIHPAAQWLYCGSPPLSREEILLDIFSHEQVKRKTRSCRINQKWGRNWKWSQNTSSAPSTGIRAGKSKTTCVSCIWGQDSKCTSQCSMCLKALSNHEPPESKQSCNYFTCLTEPS